MNRIDTNEQAHAWIDNAMICAQRCKSKLLESMGDTPAMRELINDLNPGLLEQKGKVDIVSMCQRYSDKKVLTRNDILTAMTYIERVGPALLVEFAIRMVYFPDDAMEWFRESELPIMDLPELE